MHTIHSILGYHARKPDHVYEPVFGDRNTISIWVLWATPTIPWLKDAKDSRETPLGRTTALKPRSRYGISTDADASTSYIHDLGTVVPKSL